MKTKYSRRLPLALKQLADSPIKTAAACAGICFSNVLVFFQLGLLDAIFQSQERPYKLFDGDIIIVSSRFNRLSQTPLILKSDVARAQGVEGVQKVSFLSIGLGTVLILPPGFTTTALVYAIDPANSALNIEKVKLNLPSLNLYERAVIDSASYPLYVKYATESIKSNGFYQTNLNNMRLLVNSTAVIGATFAAEINYVTSNDNFKHYFPTRNPRYVNLGIVKVKNNYSVPDVLRTLRDNLYPNGYQLVALSIQEASSIENSYWKTHTSLSFIFGLGVVVGFVVSGIILYQILFSDVSSHLSEYATLVAIGYPNTYVVKVVFTQAMLLAIFSFPFAVILANGLYTVMSVTTNLVIYMTIHRLMLVFTVSSVTSIFSCYLATGKLRKVDPSTLY